MELDVTRVLQAQGQEIPFALRETPPPTDWNGDTLVFVEPVEVEGAVAALQETVWVRAKVRARMQLPCAGCLADAAFAQEVKLDACFVREPDPDDPDLFAFEGHTLQLDDAVLGALFTQMPMRVLCHSDCKGICPACGADRNVNPCACQKEVPSKQPFSALASLLTKDEEV